MDKNYREAFAEVLEVIKNSDEDIKDKISKKFINFLEQNEDKDYIVKIDFDDMNWEDSLKQETLAVLALIYRDYIALPEEKEKLLVEEQEELIRIEKELIEKYNTDNIFKKHNQDTQIKKDSNMALAEYKESIFSKIKKWLKQIFRI